MGPVPGQQPSERVPQRGLQSQEEPTIARQPRLLLIF